MASSDTPKPPIWLQMIDSYRKAKDGISDREFERRAELASGTLTKARKNGKRPDVETLQRIAGAIGCTVGQLLGEKGGGNPDAPEDIVMVPLARIANRTNPRRTYDPEALIQLAGAIFDQGLLNPLLVRADGADGYDLIAGQRRWLAMRILVERGIWNPNTAVACKIVKASDQQARVLALMENLQREDMDPLDEGEAFQHLVAEGIETKDIAARVRKDIRYVQGRIALVTKLPEPAKKDLKAGKISVTQARDMVTKPKPAPVGQAKKPANAVRRAPDPGPLKAGRQYNPHPNALKGVAFEFISLVSRGADGPMPLELTLWDPVNAHEARYIRADRAGKVPLAGTVNDDEPPTKTQAAALGVKPGLRRPDLRSEDDAEDMPDDLLPARFRRKKA